MDKHLFLYKLSCTYGRIINLLRKNKHFAEYLNNKNRQKKDLIRQKQLIPILKELYNTKPFPLPTAIEIETLNRCNGDCDFCPVNKNLDNREYKVMENELFYSIIQQLKDLDYKGYISAYSNNEPLLDERIFDFVKHIKQELPNAKNFLFTNGLLLNLDKFLKLIPHLDYLVIDHYYEGKLKLRDNIAKIANYVLEHPELKSKIKIQTINKHAIRNNRAGEAKNRKKMYKIQASCLWPFSQMVIRPTGEISLCCNDALGKITMGDLKKDSLIDIWRSEKYDNLRNMLLETRTTYCLCAKCDSFGLEQRDDILKCYNIGENWHQIEQLLK